jgi:hypothetical protein
MKLMENGSSTWSTKNLSMSQSKESPPKKDKEILKVYVEFDSCYRGKIEIWKDVNGKVVSYKIIR